MRRIIKTIPLFILIFVMLFTVGCKNAIKRDEATGFSSTYYSSNIGGSSYTQEMDVKIGDKEIEMEIELVRNDKGYGIYSIEIDE
ncbi:MAG: hypothetical protein E7385_02220 [Ruminococcaceae bacterium]|nr:hypothetical protein [Oscillospiraceae bacterium]